MRSKLFGRLMSFTLSATVALTSGIPALAYDGGGGELPDEEEIQLLEEEEEIGADLDVEEEQVESEEFFAEDEFGEFESTDDVTITFANANASTHVKVLNPDSVNGAATMPSTVDVDSTKDYVFEIVPDSGYAIDKDVDITLTPPIEASYQIDAATPVPAVKGAGFEYVLTKDKATVTVYSAFLKAYKTAALSKISTAALTVTVNNEISVADSYALKVIGTSVAATNPILMLTVGTARITTSATPTVSDALYLGNYELSSSPISGVKIYQDYGTADQAEITTDALASTDVDGTDPDKTWFYDTATKILYMDENFIQNGYDNGKDVTVVCESNGFTITQDSADKALYGTALKFKLAGTASYINSAIDYSKDVVVEYDRPAGNTTRTLTSIDYVITYQDGTVREFDDDLDAIIDDADLKNNGEEARSIVVSDSKSTEVVASSLANCTVTGNPITTVTGKDFKFSVSASVGYEVTEVGYKLGEAADATLVPLSLTSDNVYTIPASAVTQKITIVAKASVASKVVKVKARVGTGETATLGDYNVLDKETKRTLATEDRFAAVGKNYDFIITDDSNNYSVKKVTYTLGGGTTEKDDAIVLDAAKGLYRIPAASIVDESAIEIVIYSYANVKVTIPANPNVVLSVGGVVKDDDFYVRKGEQFTFSITPASSNVEIEEVSYVIGANTTTPTLASSYTIADAAMSDNVTIHADTVETVLTTKYKVVFSATNANYGWNKKTNAAITAPTSDNNVLLIARTDTAVLTPTITKIDGTTVTLDPGTAVGKDTLVYAQASTLKDDARVAIISQTSSSATTATVVANQIGTETLKYTITDVDPSAADANTCIYEGTLALEVKPHYAITLAADTAQGKLVNGAVIGVVADDDIATQAGTDAKVAEAAKAHATAKYRAEIEATVINSVTHASINVGNISPAGTIKWVESTGNRAFILTKGSACKDNAGDSAALTAGDLAVRVAAFESSPTAGSFNVVITQGTDADGNDVTYTAEKPVSLYAIEDANLAMVPTVTLASGKTLFNPAGPITLDATDISTATIGYRIYNLDAGKTIAGHYNTQTLLDNALKDGTIEEVTDATFAMEYYKDGDAGKDTKPAPSFMSVTGSAGEYTARATAIGTDTVDMVVEANVNNDILANTIQFTVNQKAGRINVPVIMNDSTNVIKLSTSYLNGKNYSLGYRTASPDDGYLFKIAAGSKFVLPTESDLSAASYTNTKRKLVGWNITAGSGAIYGEGALTNKYYMPGQTVIIDSAVTSIAALWDNRYAIAAAGLYRDYGKTQEITITSDSLVDNKAKTTQTKETVPDDAAKLQDNLVIPNGANAKIGAVVTATRTNATTVTPTANTLFPAAGTGAGKIVWNAYDTNAAGAVSSDATERATNTVLDKTALGNGYLKPLKVGYSKLYATYTDEYGNKYDTTELKITVTDDAPAYTLDISSLPDTIEVGQFIETTNTNGVKMTKDGSVYLSQVSSTNDSFKYTITGGLTIEDGATNRTQPVLTGVSAGTATVTLTVTDVDGITVTSAASKTITVKPASVKINFTDDKGVATTETAAVKVADTDTTLYVTATNPDGNYVDGTFSGTSSDVDILAGPLVFKPVSSNTNIKNVTGTAGTDLGTADLTIVFTTDAATPKTYIQKVPVKSYWPVTFDKVNGLITLDTNESVTDLGTKVKVTDAKGVEQDADYIEKIFAESVSEDDGTYNLDLANYKAVYSGTAQIEFVGWVKAATASVADRSKVLTTLKDETAAVTLIPVFADTAITSINVSTESIVLNNADADLTTPGVWDEAKKSVEISTAPVKSVADVSVKSSASNTGATDEFFYWASHATNPGTTSNDTLPLITADATGSVRKFDMTIGTIQHKVGTTTLTVSATGSTVEKEILLTVYGDYTDSKGGRYRYENGSDAVDTSITIGKSTDFYDEDGYKITTNRTAHDADGNLVLLKGGVLVTADGYHASADKYGNDYFTKDGKVVTGLVTVNGVQRYANTKGVLVTYAMTEKQGTPGVYTDPDSGESFTIAQADNAAEPADIKYAPTVKFSEWPSSYTKGDKYPKITYTVTYTSAKKGTTIEDKTPYEATVTSDPATIDDKTQKVTFTATANLKGFYADKDGTKAAADQEDSKSYLFFDNKEESEEVIEISDDDSAIVISGLKEEYDYTGGKIMPVFTVYDLADGIITLARGTDYTVSYKNNVKVGVATLTVTGKGNYTGKALSQTFKIVDRRAELSKDEIAALAEIKGVKLAVKKYVYTGKPIYPSSITIKDASGEKTYTYDEDAEKYLSGSEEPNAIITVSNNINAGSAKITVTGKDNAKGKATSKSASFTITKAPLVLGKDGKDLEVALDPTEMQWQAKGAEPTATATWNGEELLQNQDFTVKYVDNKKIGTASVTITGKGNFSGTVKAAATFTVTALDLEGDNFYIAATTAAAGVKATAVKATVLDTKGNVIPAGKYKVTVKDDAGTAVTGKLEAEKTYTIEISKKNEKVTEINDKVASIDVTTGLDFAKAKTAFKVKKYTKYYTGNPVVFEDDDDFNAAVAVTYNKAPLTLGEDFEIVGYTNNVKKGTMTVTLAGKGKYSGTKTFKVKISAKKLTK